MVVNYHLKRFILDGSMEGTKPKVVQVSRWTLSFYSHCPNHYVFPPVTYKITRDTPSEWRKQILKIFLIHEAIFPVGRPWQNGSGCAENIGENSSAGQGYRSFSNINFIEICCHIHVYSVHSTFIAYCPSELLYKIWFVLTMLTPKIVCWIIIYRAIWLSLI